MLYDQLILLGHSKISTNVVIIKGNEDGPLENKKVSNANKINNLPNPFVDSSSSILKQLFKPAIINCFSIHASSLKQFSASLFEYLENLPFSIPIGFPHVVGDLVRGIHVELLRDTC